MKEPKPVEGPVLSIEVYRLALERIEALVGCTGTGAGSTGGDGAWGAYGLRTF
jgi:hypothetical protein